MRYGIIDIGSNTIRLVIYKIAGKKLEYLLNEKFFVQLIGHIKGGVMTEEGIQYMLRVLDSLKRLASHHELRGLHCFATAPFRAVNDVQYMKYLVRQHTGLEVDLLSSDEEARLGVVGARYSADVKDGLFIDLGGGSMEASILKGGEIWQTGSVDFGSVTLCNKFVSKIFPSKDEFSEMKDYIDERLQELSWINEAAGMGMYCMGGTARAMGQAHAELHEIDIPLEKYSFPCEEIKTLCKDIWEQGTEGVRMLSKLCPGRIFTFIPGVLLLSRVAKKAQTEDMHFSLYGVREGYLLNKILAKK